MTQEIAVKNDVVAIWQDTEKIRQLFAPDLSEKEFKFFVSLGMGLKANPFTREIWAVKYDKGKPASVFLGRDFYRKKAQEQADYDGHTVDAVYENDDFTVKNGQPEHGYKLKDRGKLLGAYCICWRKNIEHPFFTFVELKEYDKGFSNWKSMPATMIKKVAEAQTLRGAYQGIFAGTYDESENWIDDNKYKQLTGSRKPTVTPPQQRSNTTADAGAQPPDDLPLPGDGEVLTAPQHKLIMAKIKNAGVEPDELHAYLDRVFGIASSKDIPKAKVNEILEWIDLKAQESRG